MWFFPSWECCAGNNLHHLVIVKAIDWNDCQAHSVLLNGCAFFFIFYYRLYLASMHHNENASRVQATTSAGQAVYKVVYPKAKMGEGVVKPVKTDPTFSKFVKDNL